MSLLKNILQPLNRNAIAVVVNTYADMLDLKKPRKKKGLLVYVKDASGDPNIISGGAVYVSNGVSFVLTTKTDAVATLIPPAGASVLWHDFLSTLIHAGGNGLLENGYYVKVPDNPYYTPEFPATEYFIWDSAMNSWREPFPGEIS